MHMGQTMSRWARWGRRGALLLLPAIGVVLLLLWLAGRFEAKVPAGGGGSQYPSPASADRVVEVRIIRLPLTETAAGTIRPVRETTIGSKLLARVTEVNLRAGQPVRQGDVLVRLDDTDLKARLKQAEAALASAEAARAQAETDVKRYEKLVQAKAISQQDYERAVTALKSADAELRRAHEAINESQATLDFATVRSPMDGTVIDKQVDVGDMVTPGQKLTTILDPKQMQLVASVRESLASRLEVGQSIDVQIEPLDKQCTGTISEIVPEAQSTSRSFEVKVTGPCPAGVYSGMFARLIIPLDEEELLVIPREAVRTVGQLELVDVVEGGRLSRRAIRAGRVIDGNVEVLSGLRAGERVQLPAAPAAGEAADD